MVGSVESAFRRVLCEVFQVGGEAPLEATYQTMLRADGRLPVG